MNDKLTFEEILKLFKHEEYFFIIEQVDSSYNAESLFIKTRSYLELNMIYEAFDFMENNQQKMCYFSINSYLKLYTKILIILGKKIEEVKDILSSLEKYENNKNDYSTFIVNLDKFYGDNFYTLREEYNFKFPSINIEELKEVLEKRDLIKALIMFLDINENDKNIKLIRNILIEYLKNNPNADFLFAAIFELLSRLKVNEKILFQKDGRIYNLSPFENRSSILNHSYIVDKKLHEVGDFIKNIYILDFISFLMKSSSIIMFPNYMQNYEDCVYYLKVVLDVAGKHFNIDLSNNYLYKDLQNFDFKDIEFDFKKSIYQFLKKVVSE